MKAVTLEVPPAPLSAEQSRKLVRFNIGTTLRRCLEANASASWGLFYGAYVTRGWACCIVTKAAPEVPLEAFPRQGTSEVLEGEDGSCGRARQSLSLAVCS